MAGAIIDQALHFSGESMVAALVQAREDQWYERKSGRIAPKDLAVALVALANADGGVIVVGLHDGTVDGVEPQRENDLRQANLDHCAPPVRARVEEVPAEGRCLLIFRVEPGDTVHTLTNGACYLRVGDESRKLTPAQHQELIFDRGGRPYEATPVDLSASDLDAQQLDSYRQAIGSSSVEEMLAARDLVDRRGNLTAAAALLFDARPQREFPSAHVRVMRYGADQRGTGSQMSLERDVRVEGSIPHQIMAASQHIEKWLPGWQQLGERGLFETRARIPRDAWLEGLVNAVVHRSYSMMGDHIRVEIFPNRLEITSPGRFPGIVDTARPLKISRYARNPRIARVCADMGITRELGEGIKRMFTEMRRRGLVDPIYAQSASTVTLVLSAADALAPEVLARLPRNARRLLDELRLAGRPLGTGHLAELAGVARPTAKRALDALEQEGLITWQGQSARDPRATWHLA